MSLSPGPTFRRMRPADAAWDDLLRFDCGDAPWHAKVAEFLRSGEAWDVHDSGDAETLLYCDDDGEGGLIGFANVMPTTVKWPDWKGKARVPCLLIAWFAVGGSRAGLGHGRAMIGALAVRAARAGLAALYLLVDRRNDGAIGFYRTLGFREITNAPVYVDPSDDSENIRMLLPLA